MSPDLLRRRQGLLDVSPDGGVRHPPEVGWSGQAIEGSGGVGRQWLQYRPGLLGSWRPAIKLVALRR